MLSSFSIRLYVKNDSEYLRKLYTTVIRTLCTYSYSNFELDEIDSTVESLDVWEKRMLTSNVYVAVVGDLIVGFACYCSVTDQIKNIFIALEHQNKGYGTKLLHHCEKDCENAGKNEIFVTPMRNSWRFFLKNNYSYFNTTRNFLKDGVIQEKQILRKKLVYFPPMRVKKREKDREWINQLLEKGEYGVLSLNGTNGYGYGVPVTYAFVSEKDCLYIHGAFEGFKIDCIKKDNHASFCVVADYMLAFFIVFFILVLLETSQNTLLVHIQV
jgi:GNAT superfamily N-acetyltransferase